MGDIEDERTTHGEICGVNLKIDLKCRGMGEGEIL